MFELSSLKPILTALVLPPVPLLLLILIGARLILPKRGLGFSLVLIAVVLLWLSACEGTGRCLQTYALRPPAALWKADFEQLSSLAQEKPEHTVILVLGGGMVPTAPEYGLSDLSPVSAERLRYGVYLSKRTGLPLAFSGGLGWAQLDEQSPSEAEIAQRIALQMYKVPMRWVETESKDTRGNARFSVRLLRAAGITNIVLVTNAWHMPRALRDFQDEAQGAIQITPAPMGFFTRNDLATLDWLPSFEGYRQVHFALHELLGLLVGA